MNLYLTNFQHCHVVSYVYSTRNKKKDDDDQVNHACILYNGIDETSK